MKGAWEGREADLAARLISDETPMFPLALSGEAIRVRPDPRYRAATVLEKAGVEKGG
jgi:hypothetical protein